MWGSISSLVNPFQVGNLVSVITTKTSGCMIQSSSREGKCSRTITGLKAALVLLTGQQIVKAVDRYRVNLQSIGIGFIFSGGVVELFGFLWAVPALGVREGALWIFPYYGVTFFSRTSLEGTFVGLGCRFGGCGGPIVVCTRWLYFLPLHHDRYRGKTSLTNSSVHIRRSKSPQ